MPTFGAPELLIILAVLGVVCVLPLAGAVALVVLVIRDRRRGRPGGELRAENRALLARMEVHSAEPTPEPPTPHLVPWMHGRWARVGALWPLLAFLTVLAGVIALAIVAVLLVLRW